MTKSLLFWKGFLLFLKFEKFNRIDFLIIKIVVFEGKGIEIYLKFYPNV